jgi:hypothetical protein
VLPLTACGKDSASSSSSDTATLAPASSIVYAEANLDSGGDVDQLLAKFPGGGDAGGKISALIEKALKEDKAPISYEQDVKPWLGDQIGFFVNGRLTADGDVQDAAAIIATTDEDAAMAAVDKAAEGKAKDATYKDTDYKLLGGAGDPGAAGIVDGALVVGTVSGFEGAVDAAAGAGLQDNDKYKQAIDGAAEDRLGLVYVDMKAFYDIAATQAGAESLQGFKDAFTQPYVVTLDADADGVELAATITETAGLGKIVPFLSEGTDLIGDVPAGSWLAIGQPELGKTIGSVVDVAAQQTGGRAQLERQLSLATGMTFDELTSWMGDFALYVKGTSLADLSGALIVETTDEAQSTKVLAKLGQLAAAAGGAKVTPSGDGFTVTQPSLPQSIHVLQRDGKVIVAYGDEAAQEAVGSGDTLADSTEYKDATASLGDGYAVSTWISIAPILQLLEGTPAANENEWAQVKSYLEPLGAIVSGAKADGDKVSSVLRVTVP